MPAGGVNDCSATKLNTPRGCRVRAPDSGEQLSAESSSAEVCGRVGAGGGGGVFAVANVLMCLSDLIDAHVLPLFFVSCLPAKARALPGRSEQRAQAAPGI